MIYTETMQSTEDIDQVRAEREAAIAQVMLDVDKRKKELASYLAQPIPPAALSKVRIRNSNKAGVLGAIWAEFIDLPQREQVRLLEELRFKGMSWQSLMQCNPYRLIMSAG